MARPGKKKTKTTHPHATSLRAYHALRISKELKRLELSIRQFATDSGVSRQLLSAFLNSPHCNISLNILERLYEALDEASE